MVWLTSHEVLTTISCGSSRRAPLARRKESAPVKPLELGPSPRGHTRYAVRSGKHRRNSLAKLDVDAAGSRVLDALNQLAKTQ